MFRIFRCLSMSLVIATISTLSFATTLSSAESGYVFSWGQSDYSLGLGGLAAENRPVLVKELNDVVQISSDKEANFAITAEGRLFAWGCDSHGELGLASVGSCIFTPTAIDGSKDWQLVFTHNYSTFGLKRDGRLFAWGNNSSNELGLGDRIDRSRPTELAGEKTWKIIYNNEGNTFAINKKGELYAWGRNSLGELGFGDRADQAWPKKLTFTEEIVWKEIIAKNKTVLALTEDGRLFGWGRNSQGQLGLGDKVDRIFPHEIKHPDGLKWLFIETTGISSFAINQTNIMFSWGSNRFGQLGLPDRSEVLMPTRDGSPFYFKKIVAADNSVFGISTENKLIAWGRNDRGQLGQGNKKDISSPTQIIVDGVEEWLSVTSNGSSVFAISADRKLYSWGLNLNGQLGADLGTNHIMQPAQIEFFEEWLAVHMFGLHIFAVKKNRGNVGVFLQSSRPTYAEAFPEKIVEGLEFRSLLDEGKVHSFQQNISNEDLRLGWEALFAQHVAEQLQQQKSENAPELYVNYAQIYRDKHVKEWVMDIPADSTLNYEDAKTNICELLVETGEVTTEECQKWSAQLDLTADYRAEGIRRESLEVRINLLVTTLNSMGSTVLNKQAAKYVQARHIDCADASIVALEEIEFAVDMHRAMSASDLRTFMSIGIAAFKRSLTETLLLRNPYDAEALEGALYLQTKLNKALQLPTKTKGALFNSLGFSQTKYTMWENMNIAMQNTTPEKLADFFVSWYCDMSHPWEDKVKQLQPEAWSKIEDILADYETDETKISELQLRQDEARKRWQAIVKEEAVKYLVEYGYLTREPNTQPPTEGWLAD